MKDFPRPPRDTSALIDPRRALEEELKHAGKNKITARRAWEQVGSSLTRNLTKNEVIGLIIGITGGVVLHCHIEAQASPESIAAYAIAIGLVGLACGSAVGAIQDSIVEHRHDSASSEVEIAEKKLRAFINNPPLINVKQFDLGARSLVAPDENLFTPPSKN